MTVKMSWKVIEQTTGSSVVDIYKHMWQICFLEIYKCLVLEVLQSFIFVSSLKT